jgi:DNA-directed RNA polymerase sigma subunit (sigma70/sigma32)
MKVPKINAKHAAGQDSQTLQEIATSMGLTRERIRQIEGKALTKAKRILLKQGKGPEDVL